MLWQQVCSLILIAISAYISAPDDVQRSFRAQLTPAALVLNVAQEYSSWVAGTLAHEAGHALLAKKLTGYSPIIHLGVNFHTGSCDPLFKFGNVHLDGLRSTSGQTTYSTTDAATFARETAALITQYIKAGIKNPADIARLCNQETLAAMQKRAALTANDREKILLIGGFCGALGHALMQLLWKQEISLDFAIVHQLIQALIPLGKGSDAYIIWQDRFGLSEAHMETIAEVGQLIDLLACITCTAMDPRNAPNAPWHTLVLLGILNHQTYGYVRFYAGSALPTQPGAPYHGPGQIINPGQPGLAGRHQWGAGHALGG